MNVKPQEIVDYWYSPRLRPHWFKSTEEIDREITGRYRALWEAAAQGELDSWMSTPQGCLALAIVLDQFPLNMFRGDKRCFSSEAKAIAVAKHTIGNGLDKLIEKDHLTFLYMPLMHSEDLDDQENSVKLFRAAGLRENAAFAEHHKEIVRRFGRFPHRNEILGRESTEKEVEYLNSNEAFRG